MKNLIFTALAALFLLGCSQKISVEKYEKTKINHQKQLAYLQMFDLHSDITLLEILREKRIDEAIELLEGELDTDIVLLNNSSEKEQNQKSKNDYLEVLHRARDYRGKFPRKISPEAILEPEHNVKFIKEIVEAAKGERGFEEVIQNANQSTAIEAQQILSELN